MRPPWHVTAPQWLEQGSWELENQFTTARPMATNGMAEACTTNKAPRFVAQAACHFTRRTRTPTLWVETRLTCPPVTVRSGRDGLDPDEVGGARNHRRSVGSARCASPDVGWTPRLGRTVTSASNRSVKPWKNGRSASSPQRSSHIASVSPLSHQRSGWTSPRTGQPRVLASRETPLHGWRTDPIVPTPRVSSPHSAPSPDGGGRGTLRRLLGRHRGQTRRRSSRGERGVGESCGGVW